MRALKLPPQMVSSINCITDKFLSGVSCRNDSWQPVARDSGKKPLNKTACPIMGIVSREELPRKVQPVIGQQPRKGGVGSAPEEGLGRIQGEQAAMDRQAEGNLAWNGAGGDTGGDTPDPARAQSTRSRHGEA